MDHKQFKRYAVLTAVAAAGLYGLIAGKGPFNRMRFGEQHDALAKYVDNNHPGCSYSPIAAQGRGWTAAVRRRGRTVAVVYFIKSTDGAYVFTESRQSGV